MLRTFEQMNVSMERTGSLKPAAQKEELLQMVAKNNLLFTDIISKLGIMERFDVAWKNPDCNQIYEKVQEEMEIENRYDNVQTKVWFGAPCQLLKANLVLQIYDVCPAFVDIEIYLG